MAELSFRNTINDARSRLAEAGVASPDFDCWALASHVTGVSRGELQARAVIDAVAWSTEDAKEFEYVLARRVAREPLWQITGSAPFLGLELSVAPGVFTPRPETELLAHAALEEAMAIHPAEGVIRVVDVCAGSGAIGLWIARQLPIVDLLSVEVSPEAARYLSDNINRYAPDRSHVLVGDLGEAAAHPWAGRVDLVVSNPPYLIPGELVDVETDRSDPDLALYGGADGLEVIRRLVPLAAELLRPGGVFLVEHGVGHKDPMASLLARSGFGEIHTEVDLVGRERFTRARAV